MKFDKELLLKHKFWILLGTFTLIWLIGLTMLMMGSASAIEEKKKAYETATKALSGANYTNPKNPGTFLEPWKQHAKRFHDHKEVLWKEAWDGQKSLISWPGSREVPLDEIWNKAASFKDWQDQLHTEPFSTRARAEYKEDLYIQQFENLDPKYKRLRDLYPNLAEGYNKLDLALLVAPVEFKNGLSGFEEMMPPHHAGGSSGGNMGNQGFGPRDNMRPPDNMRQPGGPRGQGNTKSLRSFFKDPPSVEEVWLAQEDFWVKSELLHVIRQTLDQLALFREVKPDKVNPGYLQHRRFRNNTWQLDLLFENKGTQVYLSSKSTIRNIDPSKRVLMLHNPYTNSGIEFLLTQTEDKLQTDFKIDVKGEPLPYLQVAEFNFKEPKRIDNLDPTRNFVVEQVFDWSNAPIRRIDAIQIGAQSHRTFPYALKANPAFKVEGQPSPDAPARGGNQPGQKPGGSTGAPPTGGMSGSMGMGGGEGGMGGMRGGRSGRGSGQSASSRTEPNGLERDRYLYVTEQCRHMPIGLVVVLEQEHIHDLMVMLSTSRLRFGITQVQLKHVRGVRSELAMGDSDGNADSGRGRQRPGEGRPGPSSPQQPTMLPGSDENLVELSIYGVAALYDRYSGKATTGSPKDSPKGPPKGNPKDKPKDKPQDKPKDKPTEKPKDKPKGKPADQPTGKQ